MAPRTDYPLGGSPNVIEPMCTFSAPMAPCTTPPLMMNCIHLLEEPAQHLRHFGIIGYLDGGIFPSRRCPHCG
jgi:hypothetical protein